MKRLWVLLFVVPVFAQNPCEDKFYVKISNDIKQEMAYITYMPEMSDKEYDHFSRKLAACQEKTTHLKKDGKPFKKYTKCISGNCVNGKGTLENYSELWNYSKISWDLFPYEKYVGDFRDGKYDGWGTLAIDYPKDYLDEKYEGEWKEGLKHGFGRHWNKNTLEYAGEWEKGFHKTIYQMISSPKVLNNQVSYTTSDTVEGRIDGDFEGWEGETIVKLMNGEIWQQTEYYYYYHYAYSPKVTIVKSGSTYKMKVDGVSKAVGVVKLK